MLEFVRDVPFRALGNVPTDGTPVLVRIVYYANSVLHDVKIGAKFYLNGQDELIWMFLEPHPPVTLAEVLGWKELEMGHYAP